MSYDAIYLRFDMCLMARVNKDLYHIEFSIAKYIEQACLYIANILDSFGMVKTITYTIKILPYISFVVYVIKTKLKKFIF